MVRNFIAFTIAVAAENFNNITKYIDYMMWIAVSSVYVVSFIFFASILCTNVLRSYSSCLQNCAALEVTYISIHHDRPFQPVRKN